MKKLIPLQIIFPEELYERLRDYAHEARTSMGKTVRQCVRDFLDTEKRLKVKK